MTDIADKVSITHHVQGQGGKYVANVEGESAHGTLEWEPRGEDVRVATHTIVPRKIGGQGIARMLVERLVADARRKGFRIDPRCSYVAAKFDENPEWSSLRA
ncbi:MAG: GNAT family N-acetyltransferase [Erythrobacter sp.]